MPGRARGRVRIPRDVAEVLDVFQKLGDAARRALHVAEKRTRREVEDAARRAEALRRRLGGGNR